MTDETAAAISRNVRRAPPLSADTIAKLRGLLPCPDAADNELVALLSGQAEPGADLALIVDDLVTAGRLSDKAAARVRAKLCGGGEEK